MKYITKEQYTEWEKSIIDKFYTHKKHKTPLIPKNGKRSVVWMNKVVIVLDLLQRDQKPNSKLVEEKHKYILDQKDHVISLFHIGKQKNDFVDVNYDENKDVFLHPVIDFGGLTNYRQPLGKVAPFLKSPTVVIHPNLSGDKEECMKRKKIFRIIYNTWKKLSKKGRFYGGMKKNLEKCIESIYGNVTLSDVDSIRVRFIKFPKNQRVVVTSSDIIEYTNKYYVRVFGQGPDKYAEISDGKNMYCSITSEFANPNINLNNIRNEYHVYKV